jgi:hypothetical protein
MRLLEISYALFFVLSTGLLFEQFRQNRFWLSIAAFVAMTSTVLTIQQVYGNLFPGQVNVEEQRRKQTTEAETERLRRLQEEESRLSQLREEQARLKQLQDEQDKIRRALDEQRLARERERIAWEGEQKQRREQRVSSQTSSASHHEQMRELGTQLLKGVVGRMMQELEKR